MEIATQRLVREINALTVLNIIREEEPISRADIVKKSRLAFPTVMRIVDIFIQRNLVIETVRGDSEVGRKPILLCLNKDAFYVIGAAIHANLDVWIMDMQSNILAKWSECIRAGENASIYQINRTAELINMLIANSGIRKEAIAGVGVGMPGTDFKSDVNIRNSQFSGWQQNIDVKSILEEKTGLPVYADNVSRTYTYGELYYGWGRKYKDFLCVMIDFGVSGCNVVNSKIMNGAHGVSGELGHVSIDPLHGRPCYCGNKGCIESYISREGILCTLRERLTCASPLFQAIKGDLSSLTFSKAVEAIPHDPTVLEVFREAGRMLGYLLVNLVNIYDPAVIVLGGSVAASCEDFRAEAERTVHEGVFSNKARNVKVLTSLLPESQWQLGTTAKVIQNTLNAYVHNNKTREESASKD